MEMLTLSTNNFDAHSVLSYLLSYPEPDNIPTSSTTLASNSTVPFSLASSLSTVSNTDSEYSAENAVHLNPVKNTYTAIHDFMNGRNNPLNDFLQSVYMSSALGLQQVTCLPDLPLPIVELPQNPETAEMPNSLASGIPECSKASLPTNPTDFTVNTPSEFFRSLELQLMHKNFCDSQVSSQTNRNLFDLYTNDHRQWQQNLPPSFIPPATINDPLLNSFQHSFQTFPTMMFDQNNFRLPSVGELFEQQLSMDQVLGLHNAVAAGLFASNGNNPNGKIGNEQTMDGRKNRRNRTAFSKFQVDELEKCFQNSPYPDVATRERISHLIQLPEAKVDVWLKNRRIKHRKQLQNLSLKNESKK